MKDEQESLAGGGGREETHSEEGKGAIDGLRREGSHVFRQTSESGGSDFSSGEREREGRALSAGKEAWRGRVCGVTCGRSQ